MPAIFLIYLYRYVYFGSAASICIYKLNRVHKLSGHLGFSILCRVQFLQDLMVFADEKLPPWQQRFKLHRQFHFMKINIQAQAQKNPPATDTVQLALPGGKKYLPSGVSVHIKDVA